MHRTKTPKEVNKLYKDGEISLKDDNSLNEKISISNVLAFLATHNIIANK